MYSSTGEPIWFQKRIHVLYMKEPLTQCSDLDNTEVTFMACIHRVKFHIMRGMKTESDMYGPTILTGREIPPPIAVDSPHGSVGEGDSWGGEPHIHLSRAKLGVATNECSVSHCQAQHSCRNHPWPSPAVSILLWPRQAEVAASILWHWGQTQSSCVDLLPGKSNYVLIR